MATQVIKWSPKIRHDATRTTQKSVAVQYLFAHPKTAQNSNNPIGKDEVASSNLASSSKDTPKFRLRSFLFDAPQNWRPHPMPEGQIQSEVVRLQGGKADLDRVCRASALPCASHPQYGGGGGGNQLLCVPRGGAQCP